MKRQRFLMAQLLILLMLCLTVTAASQNEPTILVCPKSSSNSFWLTVRVGAEDSGKEFGAKIIWKSPVVETDVAGQISIIEDYTNKKVAAIVLAATDIKALYAPVRKALNLKIPVITIDSGLDPDPTLSLVATDNIKGARAAGDVLVKFIGGKGKVACIPTIPGAATSIMREQGFKEAIAKYEQVKLVAVQYSESDVAKGMAVTENILTANPDLAGIFACNEPGAVGASQAIRGRSLVGKVKLVAFDASPTEIEMLKNGTIQALVVQNPYKMGYLAVKACVEVLQGKVIEKRIDTGVTVVTMENYYDPQIQLLLNPRRR